MTELTWQRTPLLTLGFFIAKEVRQFVRNITNFIPALAVIFVTDNVWLPYAVGGGYLVFIFISAVLNHRFFLYALADDAVHLRTGVFAKKSLTLKYERIQQAELDQTWYFRPFGLTILRVDSAGSAGKEVEIPGLTNTAAQELRQRMLAQTSSQHVNDAATTTAELNGDAATVPDLQRHFSLAEIIRAGIIDNKVFVLLAVLIYPLSQTDILEERVVPWLEENIQFIEQSIWLNVGLVTATLLLLFTLAIGVTVVSYYNLTFTVEKQRYQARSGLFSIRTVSFRYHKLQRVQIKQNLRGRLLRRFRARVSQLQPSMHGQQQRGGSFVLPVLTETAVDELCQWLQLPKRSRVNWRRISFIALLNPSFWIALSAPALAAIGYFQWQQPLVGVMTAILIWLALQAYAIARWQNYGFAMSSGWLSVKRGVFGRTENWYPLYKTQQIDVYQSPWLRLLGYADVIIYTAAGYETIKYQPAAAAFAMQQQWTTSIADNHQRWM